MKTPKDNNNDKKAVKNIMALDPSLRAFGVAILNKDNVLYTECIKTQALNKKTRIRKGDDDIRRISYIALRIKQIVKNYNVSVVVSEMIHGSQNYSGAKTLGIIESMISCMSVFLDIPLEFYFENDIKKYIFNRRSVSKDETLEFISLNYPFEWKKDKESNYAIADAIAVYHYAKTQSSVIKLLNNN